ncbi:hypothetical protein AKUH4B505J_01620 [Apilactobacillus kunkeei]|nr:hypothetical protein AKUH4B505J_01620 [Apilactobacillus kunkeei]
MDKKFKNMALAIIPLSVMLMSAATNTYAKAATGVANGKSNEKDNSKKMSDKDLLAAANQIQNYLYGYYNESLGFVKGDYIKQLAQASLYDEDIQRQFANEINEATKQTLADKAKDDSVVASNNKAQSDASKEVDYLNYMAKSLDEASDILSKNSGSKVEFDSLKKSIASDLDNLNNALENVKDTDKHDKAKLEKAVTNLRNEIKTTEDHISKSDGNGYELTALSRLSHALDDQYNNAENTLNDLINQENGRTEDINELINSDKMQEALDKALDDTKAKFEKSDAAKMSKVDKLLNDLIKRENQRTADVKALIESDKMKEALEDAFNKQVSDTKNNLEKSDDEKMDKVNKELDALINHEKQRTSDINDLIASDKMQEELEKAAQKKLDQQVADKKAKFEKEDAAKMAKVNKQLDDLLNHEKQRTADVNKMIASDKMHEKLQKELNKAISKTKDKFEKSDAAKMDKLNNLLDQLIKHENQRSADVKDMIASDKMQEELQKEFNQAVADKKASLEKSDAAKMDRVNKTLDALLAHEKQRTTDIHDMIASDKMQDQLEKAFKKRVSDVKAKFEKDNNAKIDKVSKVLDALINHENQRTSDIHNLIDSDKIQEQLEKAAQKAFKKQVANAKAKFEKEDTAKMGKVNKELDALLNHEKQRSADIKELIDSDKLHDALEDAAKKAFAEKVAAKEAELEKDDNAKMADFNNKVDNLVKEQSSKLASIYAAMHKVENKNDKKSVDAYNNLAKTLKSFVAQQLKNVNELNKRVVKDASKKNKESLVNFEKALKEAAKKANKKHSVKKLQAQPVAALSFRMADEETSDDEYQFNDSSDIPNEYRDDYINHLSDLLGKSKLLDQESSLLTKKIDEINALKAKLSKIANLSDKEFTNSSELNDDLNALYELVNQTNNSDAADMGSMQTLTKINSLVDDLKNDYAVALADYMVKPSDDSKNKDDKKPSDDQKANDDKKSSDDQKENDDKKPSDEQKANDDKKPSNDQKNNDDKKPSDDQKNNDDNTASSTKIDGDKGNDSALTPDVKPDQPAVNPSNKNNAGQPKKPGNKPAKKAPKEKKVSIKKSKKSLAKLNKKLKHKKMTKRARKALLKKIRALKNKIKRAIVKRDKKKLAKITKKLHSKKISKKTRKRLHKQATALRKEIKKNHVKPAKKKVAKKTVKKSTKKSKKTTKKSKKSSKKSKKAAKKAKKHQKKLTKRAAKRVNTDKKAIAKITKKLKSKHLTKKHRRSLIAKRAQLRKAVRKLTK